MMTAQHPKSKSRKLKVVGGEYRRQYWMGGVTELSCKINSSSQIDCFIAIFDFCIPSRFNSSSLDSVTPHFTHYGDAKIQ